MIATPEGRLISFDEAGFTGPRLLDNQQPYFVYASHDLTVDESASLISDLRMRYRLLQGNELKAKNLKKRGTWPMIVTDLCGATHGRAKVVVHNKKVALAGKFVEYFFEPVLATNSALFYGADFHRYLMTAIFVLLRNSPADYAELAEQMQQFMRTFDPASAPDIFSKGSSQAVEMERILKFCRGYATVIEDRSRWLRPEAGQGGKWTLDLTSTALFSLLFFYWGHRYPKLRLLCDDSKPLADGVDLFNAWVGQDQSTSLTDGKASHEIRGNLVAPVEFGSSETHPTIQVADLLAGMTLEAWDVQSEAATTVARWLGEHQLHAHSVDFLPELATKSDRRVRIGREILKELAQRADIGRDPLDGMEQFLRRTELRFPS
ncbi:DUF3800 domain-containing protein [Mesorhizobium sp. M0016]|uniref:DUF3800 domain-containing protein n=1 Tax=Mesorhizobium sp. M0016 TaxID=2956843 RepID=UPI00333D27F3